MLWIWGVVLKKKAISIKRWLIGRWRQAGPNQLDSAISIRSPLELLIRSLELVWVIGMPGLKTFMERDDSCMLRVLLYAHLLMENWRNRWIQNSFLYSQQQEKCLSAWRPPMQQVPPFRTISNSAIELLHRDNVEGRILRWTFPCFNQSNAHRQFLLPHLPIGWVEEYPGSLLSHAGDPTAKHLASPLLLHASAKGCAFSFKGMLLNSL